MMRAAHWRVRWSVGVLAILLAVTGEALLLALLGAPVSPEQVVRQAGGALLMLLAFDLFVQVGQLVWLKAGGLIAAIGAAAAVLVLDPVAPMGRPKNGEAGIAHRPALAVMTGLPIRWGEGDIDATLRGKRGPSESWRWLDKYFAMSVLDTIDGEALKDHWLMLLAQPRALSPDELVALDTWVRRGGRVLILTDPSLRWPSIYPPTDPRAPPAMSLLDPLLDHWRLRLDLLDPGGRRGVEQVSVEAGGRRWKLAVAAPGRFVTTGSRCRLEHAGLFARCTIGRGKAVLIADADLMADALWVGEGGKGATPEGRIADNAPLIGVLLDELSGISRDAGREWVPWITTADSRITALLGGAIPGLMSVSLSIAAVFVVRRRAV